MYVRLACRGIWVPHPLRFSAWGHQAALRFGLLLPLSPGVPFALVSAVCLLLQVYNQFTSKSAIVVPMRLQIA